tara:strand:+ start:176 stop:1315 length:1140 start_codon:yes stop_codon:yes gene_type:complete
MKKFALASFVSLVLVGCGGGSGSDSDANKTESFSIQGTIDSVQGDSITVNGRHYKVSRVEYKDRSLTRTSLQPNMMVEISGSQAKSASVTVEIEPTIVGQISDINGTSFKVNGISLTFDSLPESDVENGDWVMVSSLPTADAGYKVLSVVAFESSEAPNEVEVEGFVNNLDLNRLSFTLGANLNVDYSASDSDDHHELANGLWVEVEGSMVSGTLQATDIDVEDYNELENGTEVEGVVTWVANDYSSFELNYRGKFVVTSKTRFEDGTRENLKAGEQIEVTSQRQGSDQLAVEIQFETDHDGDWSNNEIDLEGNVVDLNEEENRFVMIHAGKEVTVFTNSTTRYDDQLTFATLANQRIEVEAKLINQQYYASEIERADD